MIKEKELNDNLIKFWDEAIALDDDSKEEINNINPDDYESLAPSKKLFDAVSELGKCQKVLDYGCGSGWASIIIAKSGCKDITAVDVGPRIKETVECYAIAYGVDKNIKTLAINPDWLKEVPSDTYDGIVCSNVLDVLPLETSKDIIKELARISKPNAIIVIGLNFFMPKRIAEQRKMELIEDKYLIINGVLRLTSLSDEDWSSLFSPHFNIKKFDYFSWAGESNETRRLFVLKKEII